MPEPTAQQKSLIRRLWKEHQSQLVGDENKEIQSVLPVKTSGEASRLIRMLLALPSPPEVLQEQSKHIEQLRMVVDQLDGWKSTFANSVIRQYESGKALSTKQLGAVKRMTSLTVSNT